MHHELVFTTKELTRQVTEIETELLREVTPLYYQDEKPEDNQSKKLRKITNRAAINAFVFIILRVFV